MKTVVLSGKKRDIVGKKESKKLRAEDIIPAVLYGSEEPIHFSIPFAELRQLVYTPNVYLLEIKIDGEVHNAIMQDIQWHPVEEKVLHVDFLRISDDKPIKLEIPVKIEGLAKGIKMGGKLNTNLRRLKVRALASDLPDAITIDVTNLGIAESIKVADVDDGKLEFLHEKSNVIASVVITRAAKSAAGGSAAEGEEETEGEEGEAPATEE